jgi:hypothetical protein
MLNQMNMTTAVKASANNLKTIVIAGLIAGTLDMTTAIIVYKTPPIKMFQYIAGAAIGRDVAFSGGALTAALGLLIHFFIAFSWAVLYVVLYPKIRTLSKRFYITGPLYGVIVWIVMNRVVLPFTTLKLASFQWDKMFVGMLILMLCIGLPIAFVVHQSHKWHNRNF